MDELDIRERGGVRNGEPQFSDKRLFMQLLAFGGCEDSAALAQDLRAAGIDGVLYEDVNDPKGIGLLTWSDDPNFFVETLRPALHSGAFASLTQKLEYSMLGRTLLAGA